jgi:hypothetical protein
MYLFGSPNGTGKARTTKAIAVDEAAVGFALQANATSPGWSTPTPHVHCVDTL